MTLDDLILSTLRTAGPMSAASLTQELNFRTSWGLLKEITGIIGAATVLASLRNWEARGIVRQVNGEFEYVAPARAVEKKQGGLFG